MHEELNLRIEKIIKRIIDIIGSLVGIVILIPLTLIILIVNKVFKDNGPIFYLQNRIGKNGKIFKIYKYRSMVIDADEKLKQYLEKNEELRNEYKVFKKLKDDPRVTKVGKIIRKTTLDEFPQFINVLKGDMSLVGPRPYMEEEKNDMKDYYKCIISCKPGITGAWQINYEEERTFNNRLQLDCEYVNNRSLKLDMIILFKTIKMLIKNVFKKQ